MLEQLGEFQIRKQLGEGGMGAVYLGYQESLDRDVALKVLTERLCQSEKFIARFKREARSAASIVHPNVIQIYSIGEQEGVHYFAMEYVRGRDLSQMLGDGKRFTVEETLDIVMQVSEAVSCASEVGIIHRDLKPANIMMTERGLVKVTDFGLAKTVSSELDVTEAGTIVGTANYMSPEQGQGKPLDVRSDIYSLGVVFFELLAGRVPFMADQASAVLYMHVYEPPPSPSEFNPGIPAAVDRMVQRMMAKDPDDRPQDADELLKELRTLCHSLGAAENVAPAQVRQSSIGMEAPAELIPETPPDRVDPVQQIPTGSLSALVADDVESVRRLYKRVLTDLGFTVVEAANGNDAIARWQESNPALVLLDLNMPGKTGVEVLAEKETLGLAGEVIILSARKDRDSIRKVVGSGGACAYLSKPVNINELRCRVQEVMKTPAGRDAIQKAVEKKEPGKKKPADTASQRIVVFHVGPTSLSVFRGILQSLGHQVACLERVEDALTILEEDLPSLFVIGIEAADDPGMQVFDAISHLQQKPAVIVVSDESDRTLEHRIRDAKLGPVLNKPVRLGAFRWAVEQALADHETPASTSTEFKTFSRFVEQQLVQDHSYTIFDFAKDLADVLPTKAREAFDSRLAEGTQREVQAAVSNLLRKLRSDGKNEIGLRYIQQAYRQGNLEVRYFCLALLSELLPAKEEAEILGKVVTDEDFRVRCQVLQRLGELKAEEAVPVIVRFLNDDVWKVRKAAATTLEAFNMLTVIEPLVLFYSRTGEPIPDRIRNRLLGQTGAKELNLLDELARHQSTEVRIFVADFLGDLRSKLSVKILLRMLADPSARVRVAAAKACGRVQNDKLRDALFSVLCDANSEVQSAVVQALQCYPLTSSAYVFLQGLADRGKRVGEPAARLLVTLNQNEHTVDSLVKSLAAQSEEVRRYLSLFFSFLYPDVDRLNAVVRKLNAPDGGSRETAIQDVHRAVDELMRRYRKRNASDTQVRGRW